MGGDPYVGVGPPKEGSMTDHDHNEFKPHKLDMSRIESTLDMWFMVTRNVTADVTQQKRFHIKIGEHRFKVDRKYFNDDPGDLPLPKGEWEIVYEGDDALQAVTAYNRLS
jgi:hypothetical protein